MNEKKCPKCNKWQSANGFHRNKSKADGYASHCKNCCKEYQQSDLGKKTMRRYEHSKKGKKTKQHYLQSERGKAARKITIKKYRKGNKAKFQARNTINKQVQKGKRPCASSLSCIDCGTNASEYHHYLGYEKKHKKSVVPLCVECHWIRHRNPTDF